MQCIATTYYAWHFKDEASNDVYLVDTGMVYGLNTSMVYIVDTSIVYTGADILYVVDTGVMYHVL